ncbi:MAG: glutamine--fructose-6-phosphate transaminase (isomerizing) [Candidatus Pacebacteria bacterium]|nr:glutamine--fructose-6-phosphate transaminase (isomerizing) [Candidatus Paceibacterota bacterium]
MCGIAGYIGKDGAKDFLINALKRLEYRGYDSAGIAVVEKGNEVRCVKKVGRIKELEDNIKNEKWGETVGIAHTRWATHGIPSEKNAHPHSDCDSNIYLVHNGIIENYKSLKADLERAGHIFKSNTDTEVLAHLVEKHFAGNLEEAVLNALKEVEGAYALAVIAREDPDKLVVAKKSSPLVLGFSEGETFIASDPSALVGFTDRVIYMDDGELGVITTDDYKIISIENNSEVNKKPNVIELDLSDIQKNGFEYFLLKEIFECPEVIKNSTRGRMIIEEGLAKLGGLEVLDQKRLRDIERIIIIGCGSASYAAMVGEYMLEEYAGIPVEVELGSEFRYRKPIIDERTAVLVVSQSGETADSLASLMEAKRKGALTLGIVNVVGSTVARETEAGVYNHAGPEIAVASTKAFISQIVVLALITVYMGRMRGMSMIMGKRILEEISNLPKLVEDVLQDSENIRTLAKKYSAYENFLYLGRKYNCPIAYEGALKIKEISYIHAEGYAGGEMKHGPIAMIDENFPCVFIAPKDSVYEKMCSNMEEVKARGGKIIAITTKGNEDLNDIVSDTIYIPKTLEMLTPVLACIPLYLFAAYVGIERGLDIDKPRNLAKSVTVE